MIEALLILNGHQPFYYAQLVLVLASIMPLVTYLAIRRISSSSCSLPFFAFGVHRDY
jgi:hypothetical protein